MNAEVLMITKMIMFMEEYVSGYNWTHQTIDNHYPVYIGNEPAIA